MSDTIQELIEERDEKRIPKDVFSVAGDLKRLVDEKKALEKELKNLKAEIKKTNENLAKLMVEGEIQNFTRSGKQFILVTQSFGSVKADRKEELKVVLKENNYGDLVKETVNPKTLQSFINELLEENDELPEWLNENLNLYEETKVRIKQV